MRNLRPLYRIPAIPLITFFFYSIILLGYLPVRLAGMDRRAWRNRCLNAWAYLMAKALGLNIVTIGKVPTAPFFLVSNHVSYLDIVPFYHTLQCVFIAKHEAGQIPVFGSVVRGVGTILIDRSRKRDVQRVNEMLRAAMNKHQGIVLFPEGTTSSGEKILPFRPSLLEYPAAEMIPVYYACISYETGEGDQEAGESVSWWGNTRFIPHLWSLTGNREIHCTIQFGQIPIQSGDRKELASRLEENVRALLIGVRNE